MKIDINELEKSCADALAFLRKNCNPHCQIIISYDRIKIKEDTVGIPIKRSEQDDI